MSNSYNSWGSMPTDNMSFDLPTWGAGTSGSGQSGFGPSSFGIQGDFASSISNQLNTPLTQSQVASLGGAGKTLADTSAGASGAASFSDWLFGFTDGNNVQHAGNLMPTLSAAGGLAESWLGFQQLGLAKDQFNFQKGAFNDQYNQQVQQYNTAITDRANARLGMSDADAQSYINNNKLSER